jgi:exopolysaccharide biosynthesis polyprenyl glycosylphosphotransferase
MIRRHATALRILLAIVDAIVAIGVLGFAGIYRFGPNEALDPFLEVIPNPVVALVLYAAGWPLALWMQGLYRTRVRLTARSELFDIIRATLLFAAATLSLLFVLKLPDVSRAVLLIVFPSLAAGALVTRFALRWFLQRIRERGMNTRYLLILGTNGRAQAFADLVEAHDTLGVRVVGHLDAGHETHTVTRPILGSLDEIEDVFHSTVVDEVAICLPVSQWSRIDDIARLCEEEGKIVRIPMYVLEHTLSTGRVEEFDGVPVYSLVTGPDRMVGLIAKRALDLVGGFFASIVAVPLALAIVVAIRRDTPGPAIFRQTRVGLHGRLFEVYKFRTMIDGAESQLEDLLEHNEIRGHAFKVTNDPRVTKVGRWLRRTSLDELPQLLNVLRGEMSLVGPRPPLPSEVAGYDIWHRRRLSMKPGMTGLWQIRARREADFDRWVETDLEYIDTWSFWLDLKIMLRTIPAVLGREGR